MAVGSGRWLRAGTTDRADAGSSDGRSHVDVLLARGVGLLLVSLILVVLIAGLHDGATRSRVVLSWCEQAAFWLGIVCVAGDVLAEVLGTRNR